MGAILDALVQLEETSDNGKTVSEAKSLSKEITCMEFLVCLIIWYDLLFEINFVSKALQATDVSIDMAIRMINSLKKFMLKYREKGLRNQLTLHAG